MMDDAMKDELTTCIIFSASFIAGTLLNPSKVLWADFIKLLLYCIIYLLLSMPEDIHPE